MTKDDFTGSCWICGLRGVIDADVGMMDAQKNLMSFWIKAMCPECKSVVKLFAPMSDNNNRLHAQQASMAVHRISETE